MPLSGDLSGYGFGLALVSQMADHFEMGRRHDGEGTALTMVFTLERSPVPSPERPRR
jgi:anti-sigma regulatory factor (Ser/Thr protein kinase)